MAHHSNSLNPETPPVILTVPGLCNSGPGHWQTLWEARLPRCRRVDLGLWDDPHRNTWVNKLNLAIQRAEGPVVLAAHSLGCLVVAWWAEYEQLGGPVEGGKVIGALLVAPPDV
jgi:predicted alpha/beta hydrolase family esterase